MNSDSSHSGVENSWQNFPGSIPVLPCCEPDLSLLLHPVEGVDGLEAWKWTLASPAAVLQGPSRVWQPCLCPGHVPSLPPLAAVAVPLPLLRAWMDSWLSPFPLEQPKSLSWCKKSWCHLSVGLSSDLPLPCKPQGAAGTGRDGLALHLAHPLLYPLVLEQQGVENC